MRHERLKHQFRLVVYGMVSLKPDRRSASRVPVAAALILQGSLYTTADSDSDTGDSHALVMADSVSVTLSRRAMPFKIIQHTMKLYLLVTQVNTDMKSQ